MLPAPALQLLRFQEGGGPLSWTTAAALACAFCGDRRAVGAIALMAAGAFLLNPGWPFLPAAACLCALVSVQRYARHKAAPRRIALMAIALLATALAAQEVYAQLGRERAARREADFVASALGSGDFLVTLNEPDRGFQAGLGRRVDWSAAFWPMGLPPAEGRAAGLSDALRAAIDERLKAGDKVWLASDWVFRDPGAYSEDQDEDGARLVEWLRPRTLGEPKISPQGLYYYPIVAAHENAAR